MEASIITQKVVIPSAFRGAKRICIILICKKATRTRTPDGKSKSRAAVSHLSTRARVLACLLARQEAKLKWRRQGEGRGGSHVRMHARTL